LQPCNGRWPAVEADHFRIVIDLVRLHDCESPQRISCRLLAFGRAAATGRMWMIRGDVFAEVPSALRVTPSPRRPNARPECCGQNSGQLEKECHWRTCREGSRPRRANAGTSILMKAFMINVPGPGRPRRTILRGCSVFVRILEKGAHLRRNPRGFSRCALSKNREHLRTGCAPSNQGTLDPVPLTRKVAQPPASASFALFGQSSFLSCVHRRLSGLLKSGRAKAPAWAAVIRKRSLAVSCGSIGFSFTASAPQSSLPQALRPLSRFVQMREGPARK
jgi:hypothetical protein